jgi:hypothetical protein
MDSFEKDTLIAWFLYYMPMEQRYMLMTQLPVIYNHAVEKDVVKSVRLDGSKI